MEFAVLGDSIHILTEVTSHLKDGQVFKALDFGHCGFKFQGSEAARFKIQVSGFRAAKLRGSRFRFQGSEAAGFKIQVSGFRVNGDFSITSCVS